MPRSNDGRWMTWCAVCGEMFSQKRPDQRYCSVKCRNAVPRHTGGIRVKADLAQRTCQNPECGKIYQPVRENQISCSRTCLLKCPSYIEAQWRHDQKPERRAAQNRQRNLATTENVEERRFINLRANMSRVGVKITREQYQEWLSRQDGTCKICGTPAEGRNGHTDHDHETKRLRDLLCNNCNLGLGALQDNPELLRAAADYIERHRATAGVG